MSFSPTSRKTCLFTYTSRHVADGFTNAPNLIVSTLKLFATFDVTFYEVILNSIKGIICFGSRFNHLLKDIMIYEQGVVDTFCH